MQTIAVNAWKKKARFTEHDWHTHKKSYDCNGASYRGLVKANTSVYVEPGGEASDSVSKNSIYYIHGDWDNYYAIRYSGNTKRYIKNSLMYILPVKGEVISDSGVAVRKEASKTGGNVSKPGQGVCWGCFVTIEGYEKGDTSECSDGWYYITSNTG